MSYDWAWRAQRQCATSDVTPCDKHPVKNVQLGGSPWVDECQ